MKRPSGWTIALLVAAFAGVMIALALPLSVDASIFEPRYHAALQRSGFHILRLSMVNGEEIPPPLTVRWHPSRWHLPDWTPRINTTFEFPSSAAHHTVTLSGSPPVDCFIRYLENHVVYIEIHAVAANTKTATVLRSALLDEFPGLPIKIMTQASP